MSLWTALVTTAGAAWMVALGLLAVSSLKRKLCGAGRVLLLFGSALMAISSIPVATAGAMLAPYVPQTLGVLLCEVGLGFVWLRVARQWAQPRILRRGIIYARAVAVDNAKRHTARVEHFARENGLPVELARMMFDQDRMGGMGFIIVRRTMRPPTRDDI